MAKDKEKLRPRWMPYLVALLLSLLALLIRMAISGIVEMRGIFVTFNIAVTLSALYGGLLPGLLATLLSSLLVSFIVQPAVYHKIDAGFLFGLVVFVIGCLIISYTCELLLRARSRAVKAEEEAKLLQERKQADEALKESEERYSLAIAGSNDGIWEWDLRTNEGFFSPRWMEILGYAPGEIEHTAEEWKERIHPDDVDRVMEAHRQVIEEGKPHLEVEYRLRHKDGSYRWILGRGACLRDSKGRAYRMAGSHTDITGKKVAEEKLRAAKEEAEAANRLLAFHLDNSPLALLERDRALRISRWSKGAERIFGWKAEEVLGKTMQDVGVVYEDDLPMVIERFQKLLHGSESRQSGHNRNNRKDRGVITCEWHNTVMRDDQGMAISFLSIAHDVTWRIKAEEELRRAKEEAEKNFSRYRAVVEDQTEYIARFSTDGVISFANEALCRFFGRSREEILGMSFFPAMEPQAREGLDRLLGALTPENPVVVLENRITGGTGEERWHQWSNRAIFDKSGNVIEYQGVGRDITERKGLEESFRQAKEEADKANQAKSDFLANMSHEIRTPLNGIIGLSQLLETSATQERNREFARMINQSGLSLLSIVNDILDLAKIEAGKVELAHSPFGLRDLLRLIIEPQALVAARKGVEVLHSVDVEVPDTLVGDQGRLRQVLINLVGNATKFTERGKIAIAVSLEEQSENGTVGLLFMVKDTGIGIPEDSLSSIFDAFSQVGGSAHVKFGGTGLGLAISRQLVEMMGGRIWVESREGQGSTFFLSLRFGVACDHGEARPHEGQSVQYQAKGDSLRILLAEDNMVNRILAEELLRSLGHRVVAVENGLEALACLSKDPFDLVFMDLRMPVMDGLEATRRIRSGEAGRSDIPIIALTAHALKGDRERFIAGGMNDYLPKPVNLEELDRVLERVRG